MENGPFIDGLPIKTSIYNGFSMAMLVITRGYTCTSPWFLYFPNILFVPMDKFNRGLHHKCWCLDAGHLWLFCGSFWSKVNGNGKGISSDGLAVSSVSSHSSCII